MAQFAKVNGDYKPVLNVDAGSYVNTGANAVTSNVSVQPQGPRLSFVTVEGDGALTGAQVGGIIRATEQLATVHIYEFNVDNAGSGNSTLAIAFYPIDAWDTANLEANINAQLTFIAGGVATTVTGVTATATFTGITYPA
jgi:hypothetical protein